jgi:hypothetical protein
MGGGHLGSRRLGSLLGRNQLFPHGQNPAHPSLDEYLPLIGLELRRARRYERQLSALALALDRPLELPRGRATDIVAVSRSHNRLLVVLPEAGPDAAADYAERLVRDTGARPLRTASFPDDALTLDVLLRLVLES